MKYLAVFLAVLSAGRAYGAEPTRFVPEKLMMSVSYTKAGGGDGGSIRKTFSGAEPRDLWLNINDRTGEYGRITITPEYGVASLQPASSGWKYDKLRGLTGVHVLFKDNYGVSTYMRSEWEGNSQTSLMLGFSGDRTSNFLPDSDDPYQQRIKGSCGVPENISNIDGYSYLSINTTLPFTQDRPGLVRSPTVVVNCMWYLRPIYDISLALEKETMMIEDTSGSNKVYDNSVTITGNGGPATITVVNPSTSDISVSFSVTNDSTLTYTAKPTPAGTKVPFHVLVKNTKAGSRSYTVNFTAAYN